jgi:hypothetical protein
MRDGARHIRGPGQWFGVAFGIFSAGLLCAAPFMQKFGSKTIDVGDVRMLGSWEGAACFVCAAIVFVASLVGLWRRRGGLILILGGAAALVLTVYAATGSRSIVQQAVPGVAGAVHGELGIGLASAGLAGLVAIIAGVCILVSETP